jgi:hypothetical protein
MIFGLIALALAGVLFIAVLLVVPGVPEFIRQMIIGTFILVLGLTLVGLLIVAIFDIDVTPIFRNLGVALARNRVVDFFKIYPTQEKVEVVYYEDTDGDGEDEWVVFYKFDLTNVGSPYAGTVYDYDRGNPPVVFPYRLVPPDRDYLSEGATRLELVDVVTVGEVKEERELMVYGQMPTPEQEQRNTEFTFDTDLYIFREIPNSFPWEFPRDDPRRYQVIGAFRGDGGVTYDPKTRHVTVINRQDFDRSQLSAQYVYALDENRGTYMSVTNPEVLSAPVSSVVTFAYGMPSDVLNTPYPEKLVLGFYEMLAAKEPAVLPRDFLTGQALIEFDRNNLSYFGFGSMSGKMTDVNEVTVTQLSYAPETEQIGASATVLGEEPNFQTASVAFQAEVGKNDTSTPAPIVWAITMVNGKWRIDRRLQ